MQLVFLAGGLGVASSSLRRRLLPAWAGGAARLAEIIIAVSLLVVAAEMLGCLHLLYDWLLVLVVMVTAVAAWQYRSSFGPASVEAEGARPREDPWIRFVAGAIVVVVFAQWSVMVRESLENGIYNFDSLWYHLPFAASMAQSHSVLDLVYTGTVFTNWNWFFPANSELLHGVGMLLVERDTLSPFLNLVWLLVAFLAAWCIGAPYGRGGLSVAGVATVLASETLLVRVAGTAKNDLMAAALLLAGVAILINAWNMERERVLRPGWATAVSGLAVGLAIGTKVTVLPMACVLAIGVLWFAPQAKRRSAAAWWGLPIGLTGGLWYLRNLFVAGNPLPQVTDLGPVSLPHPVQVQQGWPDYSILHYATNSDVWTRYFWPGLEAAFGPLWQVLILTVIASGIALLVNGSDRLVRFLGASVLVGVVAYLATPMTAAGPDGDPVQFWLAARFLLPAMLVGLAVLPALKLFENRGLQWALMSALVIIYLITDDPIGGLTGEGWLFALALTVLVLIVPAAMVISWRRGGSSWGLALEGSLLVAFVLALGYAVQDNYLEDRFARESGIPGYGMEEPYQWAKEVDGARIGLAGTTAGFVQYGFFGDDFSNEVVYLGEKGPGGSFNAISGCEGFRRAVNDGDLDYVVTTPFLNFWNAAYPIHSPESGWLLGTSNAVPLVESEEATVWRVKGRLSPAHCKPGVNSPLRYVPQQTY